MWRTFTQANKLIFEKEAETLLKLLTFEFCDTYYDYLTRFVKCHMVVLLVVAALIGAVIVDSQVLSLYLVVYVILLVPAIIKIKKEKL